MKTILDIQKRLAALGFSPGPLDGVNGMKTETAMSSGAHLSWLKL